ncbi:alpha/beta hydrolase [Mesorhizobium australicum]|uniref:Acetyl esterase n=1 Tax=Mesorhizobium australicum TaxID=536018 RepID=A0A1X7NHW2_9HYPH|nr:alpha/beta hydrolase [Mesorhizobium australicum]SMH36734.1 acetyl esterase [Mesorhizobium australicum]
MPLDPQIRSMLDALQAARTDPPAPVTLEESRAIYRKQYLDMSRGPDGGVVQETIALPGAAAGVTITLYRPATSGQALPLILYLHGGGFVLGDAQAYSKQSARIAESCGAIVGFLDYRLAPEHPFPAALDDTLAATRWLADNAPRLGADTDRFGLMGDSAGGNLAIRAMIEVRPQTLFRAVTLLYPVTDFRPYCSLAPHSASDEDYRTGYYLERPAMEYFGRAYLAGNLERSADPRVSPLAESDLGGLPPVAIYGGEYDLLWDQGRAFAKRLKAAGANVAYRCFDGLIHNFMQQAGLSEASDRAFRIVCAEMRAALGQAAGVS